MKDFGPVDHTDNTAEFSEAVYGDDNLIPLTHSQIPLPRESLNKYLTLACFSTLTLDFPLHHLPIDTYRPEYSDDYRQDPGVVNKRSVPVPAIL